MLSEWSLVQCQTFYLGKGEVSFQLRTFDQDGTFLGNYSENEKNSETETTSLKTTERSQRVDYNKIKIK